MSNKCLFLFATIVGLSLFHVFQSDFFSLLTDINNGTNQDVTTSSSSSCSRRRRHPTTISFPQFLNNVSNLPITPPFDQHYSWIGYNWLPPFGMPSFTPLQILQVLQNRNGSILFIGDDIGRRAFTTLYGILNSTFHQTNNNNNNNDSNSIYYDDVIMDVSVPALKSIMNMTVHQDSTFACHDKNYNNDGIMLCQKIPGTNKQLDYIEESCLQNIPRFVNSILENNINNNNNIIQPNYSLLIVDVGTTDLYSTLGKCEPTLQDSTNNNNNNNNNNDIQKRNTTTLLYEAIESLSQIPTNTISKILWKTTGYSKSKAQPDVNTHVFNAYAKYQLEQYNDMDHLSYLDWGTNMYPRSKADRLNPGNEYNIVMDNEEARLLFVQMLIHELLVHGGGDGSSSNI